MPVPVVYNHRRGRRPQWRCDSGAMDTPAVLRAGPDDVDSLVTRLEQHGPASAKVGGRESARFEISILFNLKFKCVLIAISKHNSRATNSCVVRKAELE